MDNSSTAALMWRVALSYSLNLNCTDLDFRKIEASRNVTPTFSSQRLTRHK